MNLDASTIIISLITSAIGFAYLSFGRKQTNIPAMIAGVGLMGYIYIVDGLVWQIIVGVALAILPFVWRLRL